jgi:hypothetical protein
MKKNSWSAKVLALVLAAFLFFEIKDTISGKKDFFLVRMLFSDRGYAKKIDVKPYLLNDQQVIQLLIHPQDEIQQPPQKDLYLKNVNVVLRIVNHGGVHSWGTLAYSIDGGTNWFEIDLKSIPPPDSALNKQVYDYVIPIGVAVLFDNDNPPEEIKYKWFSLYTKF